MKHRYVMILMIASLFSCNPINDSFYSVGEPSSTKEEISNFSYADDIAFLDLGEGNCYASGAYMDPDIKEIVVPSSSVSGKKVIETRYFNNLKHLEKVTLPDSISVIGFDSFCYDEKLKDFDFSNSLTEIGERAFQLCNSLTSIVLPKTMTKLGYSAFARCASLKEIEIPGGIKRLPQDLFNGCSKLSKVTLSEGIEEIGLDVFYQTDIEKIFIPKSVVRCDWRAFVPKANKGITIYLESFVHPETWDLKKNDTRFKFVYGAKREDVL